MEGYICNEAYTNERGSDEDEYEGERRSPKDASNIIRVANRLVQESAITAEKEKKYSREKTDEERGERSKHQRRDGKKQRGRRSKSDDESDDDDDDESDDDDEEGGNPGYSSISSCGEDEDYYAYKERMLKKIEEQEKKKRKGKTPETKKSDSNVKVNADGDDNVSEGKESPTRQVDKNGKKISTTTSSALGQAEPVGTGSGERGKRKRKTAKSTKRQTRGPNAADDVSGSDIRDTADEVSDIESEMAATSPRKVESVTNLAGPELDGKKTSAKDQGSEGKGKTRDGVACKDVEVLEVVKVDDRDIMNAGPKRKTNKEIKRDDVDIETRVVSADAMRRDKNGHGDNDKQFGKYGKSIIGSEVLEEGAGMVGENAQSNGKEFHVDINPVESLARGEGDFDERPVDDGNARGITGEERTLRKVKRYEGGDLDNNNSGDGDGVSDLRRGDKWVKMTGGGGGGGGGSTAIEKEKYKKRSKHRVKRPRGELKQKHTPKEEIENGEYTDAGAGFVHVESNSEHDDEKRLGNKSGDASPEGKVKCERSSARSNSFEGETKTFAMVKTGENSYLNAQKEEQEAEVVQHRLRSDSFRKRMEDADKRKGKYFNDLSVEMKVIRGVVGDDGSEGEGEDDDETYSKLNILDGRANSSDTEIDAAFDGKDYVLAKGRQSGSSGRLGKHCSFDLTHQYHDEAEDYPEYRVLVNVGGEGSRERSKIKAMKRQKKMDEVEEKKTRIVEDVRGVGDHVKPTECEIIDGHVDDEGNGIEVEIHHPQHSMSRKDKGGEGAGKKDSYQSSPERYLCKESDATPASHHHQFSEEPQRTGADAVPYVAGGYGSPDDGAGSYSSDEDHDEVEDEDGGDNKNDNPETWYRVPPTGEVMTEEFMGATEEIHRSKYINNEKERYAKNQMAFRQSPNIDNGVMRMSGGVVSVLTPQPRSDVTPDDPGIISLSVNKPGQRHDADVAPRVVVRGGGKGGDSYTTDTSPQRVDNSWDAVIGDLVSNQSLDHGEKDPQAEEIETGFHFSPQITDKLEGMQDLDEQKREVVSSVDKPFSRYTVDEHDGKKKEEKAIVIEGNSERSKNSGIGKGYNMVGQHGDVTGTQKEENEELSDEEEEEEEAGIVRRDSNYMADRSSGSLSDSGGTQSSCRVTDGRTVRKKKRKDRKQAENSLVEKGDVDLVECGGGFKGFNDVKTTDENVERKMTSKGRVAELREEDRKYSTGSIPDVIITSADESCDTKVMFDDHERDDDEWKLSRDGTNEDGDVVDGGVGGDMKEESTNVKIVSTENDKDFKSESETPNKKKAELKLQETLCDDESSADDVSGIDALIEVLEDQLADSQKARTKTGGEAITPLPIVNRDDLGDDCESSEYFEMDSDDRKCTIPTGTDGAMVVKIGKKVEDDEDKGAMSFSGGEDKLETLVSIMDKDSADEKDTVPHRYDGKGQTETSIDVTDSESVAELDKQAKMYVAQLLASIQNMDNVVSDSIVSEMQAGVLECEKDEHDMNINNGNNDDDDDDVVLDSNSKPEFEGLSRSLHVKEEEEEQQQQEKEEVGSSELTKKEYFPSHVIGDLANKDMPPSSPSTLSGRKSSLSTNQDSEYNDRRRQKNLTVSFVLEEGQDSSQMPGGSVYGGDVCSWEEADDSEKEDEYERLERELERSLCG